MNCKTRIPRLGQGGVPRSGGVVDIKKINLLINTTPALRATPPHLRRGILARFQFIHTFIDRAYG
jgi:hypothetical protein